MFSKLFVKNSILNGFREPIAQRIGLVCQNKITSASKPRYVSTAEIQATNNGTEQSYQSYFTHNPVEGYIRNSPYDVVTTPNMALDQYIWQNVHKWPNHVAAVSHLN